MTFALCLIGFALLACGTWRQSELLFGRVPPARHRRALLGAGYAMLAVSLLLVLTGPDVPRRLVEWVGLLSVAAILPTLGFWVAGSRRP